MQSHLRLFLLLLMTVALFAVYDAQPIERIPDSDLGVPKWVFMPEHRPSEILPVPASHRKYRVESSDSLGKTVHIEDFGMWTAESQLPSISVDGSGRLHCISGGCIVYDTPSTTDGDFQWERSIPTTGRLWTQ